MTDEISVGSLSRVTLIFETGIKTKWERKPTDFVTEVTGEGRGPRGSTALINAKLTAVG